VLHLRRLPCCLYTKQVCCTGFIPYFPLCWVLWYSNHRFRFLCWDFCLAAAFHWLHSCLLLLPGLLLLCITGGLSSGFFASLSCRLWDRLISWTTTRSQNSRVLWQHLKVLGSNATAHSYCIGNGTSFSLRVQTSNGSNKQNAPLFLAWTTWVHGLSHCLPLLSLVLGLCWDRTCLFINMLAVSLLSVSGQLTCNPVLTC